MDAYAEVRTIPFPVLCAALGIDMGRFKSRKGGNEWFGKCPLHDAKTNTTSFSYNLDGRYNCFSCQAKGKGAIDFTRAYKQYGFQQAVELLKTIQTSAPKEKPPTEASSEPQAVLKPLERDSWRKFAQPCPWLEERIPDAGIREQYGVFFYSNPARKSAFNNRVMIPIRDVDGQLYGYLGRNPDSSKPSPDGDGSPKYLFPPNFPKSRFLFGADVLKAGKFGQLPLRVVYVGESPWMVMRFAMMNLPAVALYGWSASPEQIEILATLTKGCYFLPDRNKYQETAGVIQALAQRLWVRVPELPAGVDDPEHLTREQILAL